MPAFAVALLATFAPGSGAATDRRVVLAVRGARTAVVDFVVASPLKVDTGPWLRSGTTANIVGGDYAGLLIQRQDGAAIVHLLSVRGMTYRGQQAVWRLPTAPTADLDDFFILTLRPGRYRATLYADRPSEFRLPVVAGLTSSWLLHAGRAGPPSRGVWRDLRVAGDAGVGHGTLPFDASPTNQATLVSFFRSKTAGVQSARFCVTVRSVPCSPWVQGSLPGGTPGHDDFAVPDSEGAAGAVRSVHGPDARLAPGPYDVVAGMVSTVTADAQIAFLLIVDWRAGTAPSTH